MPNLIKPNRFQKYLFPLSCLIFLIYFAFSLFEFPSTVASETSFITRSANKLYLDGEEFRFSGANIFWLGLDENITDEEGNTTTYPTHFRIENILDTADDMGINVVRSHMALSVGCELCIQPTRGNFNDDAFESIDYAIKEAGERGIRLILPLVDNHDFYHGGKYTYTEWRDLDDVDEFFTDSDVIADYKAHISYVLNHVNQYTGVAYKNDPTILAWETGNEISSVGSWSYSDWTLEIAEYIKNLAPNHLVADGKTTSSSNSLSALDENTLESELVDMFSGHYYPPDLERLEEDQILATANNKVYFVGEYDWTDDSAITVAGEISQDTTTSSAGTKSAKIDVTTANPTYQYYIQMIQTGMSVTSGEEYTLSFGAKASENRRIRAVVRLTDAPFTTISQEYINLTTSWAAKTMTFTSPISSSGGVSIDLNLAESTGTVWVDNFSFTDNSITNSSFEGTGESWLEPWEFRVRDSGAPTTETFLDAIASNEDIAGDLFWSLLGQGDNYGFVPRDETYTLRYKGYSDDMDTHSETIRSHAYSIRSLPVPTRALPQTPIMQRPKFTASGVYLAWRGVAGAQNYILERSDDEGETWDTITSSISDVDNPYTDTTATAAGLYLYKVAGVNSDGVQGEYSNIVNTAFLVENNSFEYINDEWMDDSDDTVTAPAVATFNHDSATKVSGDYSLRVDVATQSASTFHVQFKQDQIPIVSGEDYIISFWAKASASRDIKFSSQLGESPFTEYFTQSPVLTTEWQKYSYEYTPNATANNTYLAFNFAKSTGSVWLDDIEFYRVDGLYSPETVSKDIKEADCDTSIGSSVDASSACFVGVFNNLNDASSLTYEVEVQKANEEYSNMAGFQTTATKLASLNENIQVHASQLESSKNYKWQYRITDSYGTTSDWLAGGTFSTKLFSPLSAAGAPVCRDTAPKSAPHITKIEPEGEASLRIYFEAAQDPVEKYVLNFGTDQNNLQFGAENIGDKHTNNYLVRFLSPNTTYFFKLRAGNGCATGEWSSILSAKTGQVIISNNSQSPQPKPSPTATAIPTTIPTTSPTISAPSFTPSPLSTPSIGGQSAYEVNVSVVDEQGNPVSGAIVTLHSTPKTAITDDRGIARFDDVEPGEHTVLVSYDGFEGEQKINVQGNTNDPINLNITITKQNNLPIIIIGVVGAILFIVIFIALARRKTN